MLGSGINLLELFSPAIPEMVEMQATEEEVRENLQTIWADDLLDVYNHRTACENCTRTDYDKECPFILQTYSLIRGPWGLQVQSEWARSCKVKADPYVIERQQELLKALHLPREFEDKTINNFDSSKNDTHKQAKVKCVDYVRNFENHALQGEGLILCGPTGTGKTHLVAGIAKGLITQYLRRVKFVTVNEWGGDFVYGNHTIQEKNSVTESMKRAEVLVLDDLGDEKELSSKATVTGALNMIITYRYNHTKPTIFTTNMLPNELEQHVGQRVWSRLRGKNQQVILTGTDRRTTLTWDDLGHEVKGVKN